MAPKEETILVRKILLYLNTLSDTFFYKTHGTGMSLNGVSDIIGVYRGLFLAFEVKTPHNPSFGTPNQREFIEKIRRGGGVGAVVKSVDEVKVIIEEINNGGMNLRWKPI